MEAIHSRGLFASASAAAVFVVISLLVLGAFDTPLRSLRFSYERAQFRAHPSAELAFQYGSEHLNSSKRRAYDIEAAEHFFLQAAFLNSDLPYLNHELARIAFLKGDFDTALVRINREIALYGDIEPNTYYVRGLIHGYSGEYDEAVTDYERYIASDPTNWAALNDLAWVFLKAERFQEASDISRRGLSYFPDNPWLLNTNAIAQYELDDFEGAYESARKAQQAVQTLTVREWLTAYPGNNPATARDGMETLKVSIEQNMHSITLALASSVGQN